MNKLFRLKNKTEQYKTEDNAPVLKQFFCPPPVPQKNVQAEPLEMTGYLIQTVTTPFCKLRTSNASECTRVKT